MAADNRQIGKKLGSAQANYKSEINDGRSKNNEKLNLQSQALTNIGGGKGQSRNASLPQTKSQGGTTVDGLSTQMSAENNKARNDRYNNLQGVGLSTYKKEMREKYPIQ